MSLIHLSSNGQDPSNFNCLFPQGINLKKESEVCLLGYSGRILQNAHNNSTDSEKMPFVVKADVNDQIPVFHGYPKENLIAPDIEMNYIVEGSSSATLTAGQVTNTNGVFSTPISSAVQMTFSTTDADGNNQAVALSNQVGKVLTCYSLGGTPGRETTYSQFTINSIGAYIPPAPAPIASATLILFNVTCTFQNLNVPNPSFGYNGVPLNWFTSEPLRMVFSENAIPNIKKLPYSTFVAKVKPGTYQDGTDLAVEIADALNRYEYVTPYKGAWVCNYDLTNGKFAIGCSKRRAPTSGTRGQWYDYRHGTKAGAISLPYTKLGAPSPTDPLKELKCSFINTEVGIIGPSHQATLQMCGYEMKIDLDSTTVATDVVVTHGIIVGEMGTNFSWQEGKNADTAPFYQPATMVPKVEVPNQTVNDNNDWSVGSAIPFVQAGMTIREDGKIGIVESNHSPGENGNLKNPKNQSITWTNTSVTFGTTGSVHLAISPFLNADNDYVFQYLIKQVGAGSYTLVATRDIPNVNEKNSLWNSHHVHHVVQFNKDFVKASTPPVQMSTVNNGAASGARSVMSEPVTLGFSTFPRDYSDYLNDNILQLAGFRKECEQHANMGTTLGMIEPYSTKILDSTTVAIVSTTNIVYILERNEDNFIITSPSLPVNGYLGEGGGGGQSFPMLGIGRVLGISEHGNFSNEVAQENWIKLNNATDMRLNRLDIRLVDETGRQYQRLGKKFSCWLKFRRGGVPTGVNRMGTF